MNPTRVCDNPVCGVRFEVAKTMGRPQLYCSRACYLASPAGRESQRQRHARYRAKCPQAERDYNRRPDVMAKNRERAVEGYRKART